MEEKETPPKPDKKPIIFGLALLAFILIAFIINSMKNSQKTTSVGGGTSGDTQVVTPASEPVSNPSSRSATTVVTKTLKTEDLLVGSGKEIKDGDKAIVNYKGTLVDGTVFDSTDKYGASFGFTLGSGEVIEGWDQGVAGMKVGGKRKLTIPPELGYGATPMGTIPANSTLIFEIELVKIE